MGRKDSSGTENGSSITSPTFGREAGVSKGTSFAKGLRPREITIVSPRLTSCSNADRWVFASLVATDLMREACLNRLTKSTKFKGASCSTAGESVGSRIRCRFRRAGRRAMRVRRGDRGAIISSGCIPAHEPCAKGQQRNTTDAIPPPFVTIGRLRLIRRNGYDRIR